MKRTDFFKLITGIVGGSTLLPKKSNGTYNPGWNSASGQLMVKPTTGKKLLLFGDSITETLGANLVLRDNWPNYITGLNLLSTSNYARWAAQYKDFASPDNPRELISQQITDAITANETPDIILFAAGTNDQETLMGSYATAMGKATLDDMDRTLLYEALRWCYWKVKVQWPNAKVFSCLPVQRTGYDVPAMTLLRTALVSMANIYNIKIIDQTFESGIVSYLEPLYLIDGTHPNAAGNALIAKLIISKITSSLIVT